MKLVLGESWMEEAAERRARSARALTEAETKQERTWTTTDDPEVSVTSESDVAEEPAEPDLLSAARSWWAEDGATPKWRQTSEPELTDEELDRFVESVPILKALGVSFQNSRILISY